MMLLENYQIRQVGLILAEFVRALGMNAENKQREYLGHSIAYTEDSFEQVASQIEFLARQLD